MKKIAVINDISGFGRCALTVALPIISALGVQCCPVPTAILSSHLGFKDVFFDDYTKKSQEYMQKWDTLNIEFDGYLTGFFASNTQILNTYQNLNSKINSIIIVDPIMGDNGKLYSTYTQDRVDALKKICSIADILIPNLTEICFLTDTPYPIGEINENMLLELCKKLDNEKTKRICITGIVQNNEILNFLYENDKYKIIKVAKVGNTRCGTGDVFSSVVSACVIKGESLYDAVIKATNYITKTLEVSLDENELYGICIEKTLLQLGN